MKRIPEIYFLISVLFYWFSASVAFNPVAIALMCVCILQLIFQNKVTAITIAIIFTLINVYMILALLSEVNRFPTFNAKAKVLLYAGMFYFGLNIIMAFIMGFTYIGRNTERLKISA